MTAPAWLTDALHFALPAGCAACGVWIPGGARAPLVCDRCRSRLRRPPAPTCTRCGFPLGSRALAGAVQDRCRACSSWPEDLARARTAFLLEGPARELAHAFKYEGWASLAGPMARWMSRHAPPPAGAEGAPPVVTYVPTTHRRARRRGYDHGRLLGEAYAARTGLRCAPCLVRVGGKRSQTGLDPDARRRNVRGVFRPALPAARAVRGRHVVLVDDVLTTGATAAEAAGVLVAAGAGSVTLVTFARAWPEGLRGGHDGLS